MIAATFSGNVEHFDILASNAEGIGYAVQVKTIRKGDWQLNATRFLDIAQRGSKQSVRRKLPEPHPGLLCVFVRLGEANGADEFFVLSWLDLQKIVARHYKENLAKHGGIRPRNPESTHTALSKLELAPFQDAWHTFEKRKRP